MEVTRNHRPFVILNAAVSADGKLDTAGRQGTIISGPGDAERVDRLRAASDAVMVGGRTLLGDDPRLTVKSAALRAERRQRGEADNPAKVGLVTNATLRQDSRFLTAGPARIVILTTAQTSSDQIARLREQGAEVVVLGDRRVDLGAALACLWNLGIRRLLVEGGGSVNMELLKLGLVDEVRVYIAPVILGGATAPTLADGVGLARDEAVHLQLRSVETVDEGAILAQYVVAGRN